MSTPNHEADIQNKNIGTPGTNITLDKNQGNRSKQLTEQVKKLTPPPAKKKSG